MRQATQKLTVNGRFLSILPEELVIVAVGDASVIEAPLSELGPVSVVDIE